MVILPIQPAQEIFQIRIQPENFYVNLREHRLVGIKGREALQLNQLGLQLAGAVVYQSEVYLYEQGMRRFVRYVELGRNRLEGCLAILEPIHLPDEFLAILRHLLQQVFGKKTRRLTDPEFHRRAAALFHDFQETLILFWCEVRVEALAKGGNHELRPRGRKSVGFKRSLPDFSFPARIVPAA